MSRRNSRFQKAIRREQRKADTERATFIHEVSQEDHPLMNRKEKRRGRR